MEGLGGNGAEEHLEDRVEGGAGTRVGLVYNREGGGEGVGVRTWDSVNVYYVGGDIRSERSSRVSGTAVKGRRGRGWRRRGRLF